MQRVRSLEFKLWEGVPVGLMIKSVDLILIEKVSFLRWSGRFFVYLKTPGTENEVSFFVQMTKRPFHPQAQMYRK